MACGHWSLQKEYSFFPKTWVLPHDANDFRAQFDQDGRSKQVYIIKPDNSSKVGRTPTRQTQPASASALMLGTSEAKLETMWHCP